MTFKTKLMNIGAFILGLSCIWIWGIKGILFGLGLVVYIFASTLKEDN